MNSRLRVGMAIFLTFSLIGQTFCASFAVNNKPSSTEAEWSIVNPPKVINQDDSIPNIWTLKVKTQPLFESVPENVHPIVKSINWYQEVTFIPNPTLFDFKGEVLQFGKKQTSNFVEQALPYKQLQQLKEDARTSQHFKNGVNTFLTTLRTLPFILLCTVLCFPAVPYIVSQEILDPAKERKDNLKQAKLKFSVVDSLNTLGILKAFDARLNSLQQQYTIEYNAKPLSTYNILPNADNYAIDYVKRQIFIKTKYARPIEFVFSLKKPIPVSDFKRQFPTSFLEYLTLYEDSIGTEHNSAFLGKVYSCRLYVESTEFKHWSLSCAYVPEVTPLKEGASSVH